MKALLISLLCSCSPGARPEVDAGVLPEADAVPKAPASQQDGACLYEEPICGAACSRVGLCYVVTPGCQCACYKC